jgi:hypothetical protein
MGLQASVGVPAAESELMQPMTDKLFGIREGRMSDPFGNVCLK